MSRKAWVFGELCGVLLTAGLVLAGCREPPAGEAQPTRPDSTAIPARSIRFYLPSSGKEKRSGLYACSPFDKYKKFTVPWLFSKCADGKYGLPGGAAYRPTEGKAVWLVGKLPDVTKVAKGPAFACTHYDFFGAEAGSIAGTRIGIPVKFVRWQGDVFEAPSPCSVYFLVRLPALPAGKYQAKVAFEDYVCRGDKSKIYRPKSSEPPLSSFKPLTCEFEVREAKKPKPARAKPGAGAAGLRARWRDLTGDDAKKAGDALAYLNSMVKRGMTEAEVLRLFPPGVLIKKPVDPKRSQDGHFLLLKGELVQKILEPFAWGLAGYFIKLDKNGKVVDSTVMLGGDF